MPSNITSDWYLKKLLHCVKWGQEKILIGDHQHEVDNCLIIMKVPA